MRTYKPVQFNRADAILNRGPTSHTSSSPQGGASGSQAALQRNISWDGSVLGTTPPTHAPTSSRDVTITNSASAHSGLASHAQHPYAQQQQPYASFQNNTSGVTSYHANASPNLPRSQSVSSEHYATDSFASNRLTAPTTSKSVTFTNHNTVHGNPDTSDVGARQGPEVGVDYSQSSSARWTPTLTSTTQLNMNPQKGGCSMDVCRGRGR